jgi:hypothetical protein
MIDGEPFFAVVFIMTTRNQDWFYSLSSYLYFIYYTVKKYIYIYIYDYYLKFNKKIKW